MNLFPDRSKLLIDRDARSAWRHGQLVKVDMAFVQGVDSDPVKHAFLRAIQGIARHCASCVIAEGIENRNELEAVNGIGIRFGQGYFIARPSSAPMRSLSSSARTESRRLPA